MDPFLRRTLSELFFSLAEIEWWQDRVASGACSAQFAAGYIENEQRIAGIKMNVLSFLM